MPCRNPDTASWGQILGAGAALLGAVGLAGWWLRLPVLASVHPISRSIAPSAAAALTLLGLVTVRLAAGRMGRLVRLLAGAVVAVIALYGLLEVIGLLVGADLNREDALTRWLSETWATPVLPMSLVAGALMLLLGAALLALLWSAADDRARGRSGDAAGALGAVSVVVAAVFVLAYLHGAPLLQGSRALPLALTSAAGFLLLGAGIVAAAGPACWPRRTWAGDSVHAGMLRAFVPLSVGVVLASSFLCEQSFAFLHVNHALATSALAMVFAAAVAAAVSRVAAALGGAMDRAQTALRESRADLNRAQTVAATGSWRMNVQRNELTWSDEVYRMFGIPQGAPLTYEDFLAAVHPEDREFVDGRWNAALRGERYDIDHRILVGDTVKWVREQAELEFDPQGALLGGFGTVQDITERKLVEEERERLRTEMDRQRAWLEATLEHTEAHLVFLDRDFNFLRVNQAYARACRKAPEEFLGHNHFEFYPDRENEAIFRQVRDTGETFSVKERPFEFPDMPERGVTYWDWTLTPIAEETGEVEYLVFSLLDVTESVRQREQLVAAERARAELLATLNREIAHRVKNNLTMMGGLLQLQAAGARDPAVAEALRDAVVRLHSLAEVHDELSTAPSGEVDVLAVTRRIAHNIQHAFSLRDVAVSVEGDPVTLAPKPASNLSVIANELITNALKYGAPAADGRLQVRVQLSRRNGGLRLSVWNSGPPVAPNSLRAKPGGLGLTVVQGLAVEQYRGTFTLAPRDAGTVAEIALPEAALRE